MVTDMNCLEQFSALFVSIKVTSANAFRKLSIFFSFLLCGDIRFFVCLFFCFVLFCLFCFGFFVFCFVLVFLSYPAFHCILLDIFRMYWR